MADYPIRKLPFTQRTIPATMTATEVLVVLSGHLYTVHISALSVEIYSG